MQLNYEAINGQICFMDARAALIDYIFKAQGADLRRLDFNAAASYMGVSRRTISRYVGELAKRNIIVLRGDKLRLNERFITVS